MVWLLGGWRLGGRGAGDALDQNVHVFAVFAVFAGRGGDAQQVFLTKVARQPAQDAHGERAHSPSGNVLHPHGVRAEALDV